MASATADEVVFHQANLLFSKAGYLEDLSGFDFVQNVQEAAKPSVTYQGKYFSAPQTMQTFGMFYNKKIFEDNGITVPANWTEFLAVCEKLKTAGIVPLGSGYRMHGLSMLPSTMYSFPISYWQTIQPSL